MLIFTRQFAFIPFVALSACGGGGSGTVESITEYFSVYPAQVIEAADLKSTGTPSNNTERASVAGYGLAKVTLSRSDFEADNRDCDARGCRPDIDICELESWSTLPAECLPEIEEPAVLISYEIEPSTHVYDTDAQTAWEAGWTGLGTTISVIDDFSDSSVDARNLMGDTDYYLRQRFTHGEVVANIAGGDGLKPVQEENVTYLLPGHFSKTKSTTVKKSVGVAKDAVVVSNHVDLSRYQNAENTLNNIVAHLENSREMSAVNLSIGFNINTVGITYDELIADASNAKLLPQTDAVITVAAGNGGAACTRQNLNGCNGLGIALAVDPSTNKETILVGATTGTGSNEEIAVYSSRGGMFADRFLLASGDTGLMHWNGGEIRGTSFAAPRVAGAAAILRHKFPDLSGSDAASILLLTASKDINSDGVDDFSGISQTFGHGKLDLIAALSPVGKLILK